MIDISRPFDTMDSTVRTRKQNARCPAWPDRPPGFFMEIEYVAKVHYRAAQFPENPRVAAAGDTEILSLVRNRRSSGHCGMLGCQLRSTSAPARSPDKGLPPAETDSPILSGLHGRFCPICPRMRDRNLLVLALSVRSSSRIVLMRCSITR